jgi:Xaa-Pro aminopeptidase
MSTHALVPPWFAERLQALRARMNAEGLDLYIVRGTDRFLNEYVPTAESTRVWLTGFTGSTGDALVAHDAAWLFVDGRYDLQAAREVDPAHWAVETVPLGTAIERTLAEKIAARARIHVNGPLRVGYEPDRFSLDLAERFSAWLGTAPVTLVPSTQSLVERVRGDILESRGMVRAVDERAVGRTVDEKVAAVGAWLAEQGAAAMVVQRLDELAYLTNLRGDELPYQATFRAVALVTPGEVVVAVDLSKVPEEVRAARPRIRFVPEGGIASAVAALGAGAAVAMDPAGTTVAMRQVVETAGARVLTRPSPLTAMKARKTPEELAVMREAFRKADRVVAAAQRWLIEQVVGGARVTETDFARQVEAMFREAGAVGLSFRVISACGENAAVAHHPPDPERVIRRGEMMLLDTGAYFAEGYATDLTRTFFVGGASDQPTAAMRKYFTLTLKAAIAGMNARIPRNANGAQLDGITRAPLWAAGYDYGHGTGHGVGINVHEAPPRVASVSLTPLEEGQVFSIEPGLYLPGEAGVRIENLCTVVPDPDDSRFLRVRPLTFSPLDARLLDETLLTGDERAFLTWFASQHQP